VFLRRSFDVSDTFNRSTCEREEAIYSKSSVLRPVSCTIACGHVVDRVGRSKCLFKNIPVPYFDVGERCVSGLGGGCKGHSEAR
jgi:hypothetical protein